MNARLKHIEALISALRLLQINLDSLYSGKRELTPLEAVELFLEQQQRLKTEKQNAARRKRARLPAEKSLETFDFGFREAFPKSRCSSFLI